MDASACAGRGDLQSKLAPRNQTLSSCVCRHGFGSKEKNYGNCRAFDKNPRSPARRMDAPFPLQLLLKRR